MIIQIYYQQKIYRGLKRCIQLTELEQYHLGITMFDHALFARAIVAARNRFYGDAMAAYVDSTVATSWLVYASAGLPIATNRWARGINNFVPEDCVFRLTLSELPNLANRTRQPSGSEATQGYSRAYISSSAKRVFSNGLFFWF